MLTMLPETLETSNIIDALRAGEIDRPHRRAKCGPACAAGDHFQTDCTGCECLCHATHQGGRPI